MEMKKVESSQIAAIGYDPEKRTLHIEFVGKNGKANSTYSYEPITQECYSELMQADSKGNYFYEHIKTNDRVTFKKL